MKTKKRKESGIILIHSKSSEPLVSDVSVLVTDVGDEMCWWQVWDFSDGLGHFDHQHPWSSSNLNSVSNIKKRHFKSPTSLWVKTMVQESLKEIDYGGDEQLNAASQALIGILICPRI